MCVLYVKLFEMIYDETFKNIRVHMLHYFIYNMKQRTGENKQMKIRKDFHKT